MPYHLYFSTLGVPFDYRRIGKLKHYSPSRILIAAQSELLRVQGEIRDSGETRSHFDQNTCLYWSAKCGQFRASVPRFVTCPNETVNR
jgi:hypothetical protein